MQHEHLLAYFTAYHTTYPGIYLHKRLNICLPGTDVDDQGRLGGPRAAWQGHADIRFTLRETAIRSIRWMHSQ